MNTRYIRLLAGIDALLYLTICAGIYPLLTTGDIPLMTRHGLASFGLYFIGPVLLSTLLLQKFYSERGMTLLNSLIATTFGSLLAGLVVIFCAGPYSLLATIAANVAEMLPRVLPFGVMIGLLYLGLGLAAGTLSWAVNKVLLACLPDARVQSPRY